MPLFPSPRRTGHAVVLACAVSVAMAVFCCPDARAQSQEELERARDLFREGLSLEAAGNWAAALGKFQQVGRVKLTPQVRFHIARCKEHLGRLTEALGEYRLAEHEAAARELSELDSIRQAREDLEARIPKVIITRGEGAEQARLELDGVELGERQIGQPIGVDPGPHAIVADLPGDFRFDERIVVGEGETKEITMTPPERMREPATEPTAAAPTEPGADRGEPSRAASPAPWIIGGVGVASLGAAGVFFFLRQDAKSELDDTCRGDVCPKSAEGTQDRGELFSVLTPVALGVGVAAVGVATYLFLTGGSDDARAEAQNGVVVDLVAAPRVGGVRVRGEF